MRVWHRWHVGCSPEHCHTGSGKVHQKRKETVCGEEGDTNLCLSLTAFFAGLRGANTRVARRSGEFPCRWVQRPGTPLLTVVGECALYMSLVECCCCSCCWRARIGGCWRLLLGRGVSGRRRGVCCWEVIPRLCVESVCEVRYAWDPPSCSCGMRAGVFHKGVHRKWVKMKHRHKRLGGARRLRGKALRGWVVCPVSLWEYRVSRGRVRLRPLQG